MNSRECHGFDSYQLYRSRRGVEGVDGRFGNVIKENASFLFVAYRY